MKANRNIFFHYTCLISEGDYGTGKQLINCSITNKFKNIDKQFSKEIIFFNEFNKKKLLSSQNVGCRIVKLTK